MAAPKRTKIQRERDRVTIAELYLKGWTQAKIADYLELSQPGIWRELKKIKELWIQQTIHNYDLFVVEELYRLAMIEAELWDGWQRSQVDKEQSLQEKLVGSTDSDRLKAQRRTESRVGDVRFLDKLLECIEQRAKLLGLYSQPNNVTTTGNINSTGGLSADVVDAIRYELLGLPKSSLN